jgi:hypothetical protein
LANAALEYHGHAARIDHRSHAKRGIADEPTRHLGPAAAGYERRTGEKSRKRLDWEQEAMDRLAHAQAQGVLERESRELERSIFDLSGDMQAAFRERDRLKEQQEKERQAVIEAGKEQAREAFERFKAEQAAKRAREEAAFEQEFTFKDQDQDQDQDQQRGRRDYDLSR